MTREREKNLRTNNNEKKKQNTWRGAHGGRLNDISVQFRASAAAATTTVWMYSFPFWFWCGGESIIMKSLYWKWSDLWWGFRTVFRGRKSRRHTTCCEQFILLILLFSLWIQDDDTRLRSTICCAARRMELIDAYEKRRRKKKENIFTIYTSKKFIPLKWLRMECVRPLRCNSIFKSFQPNGNHRIFFPLC